MMVREGHREIRTCYVRSLKEDLDSTLLIFQVDKTKSRTDLIPEGTDYRLQGYISLGKKKK